MRVVQCVPKNDLKTAREISFFLSLSSDTVAFFAQNDEKKFRKIFLFFSGKEFFVRIKNANVRNMVRTCSEDHQDSKRVTLHAPVKREAWSTNDLRAHGFESCS